MTPYTPQLLDAVLRADLLAFVTKAFHTLNQGQDFLPNWHLEAIAYQLTRLAHGQARRLIVNLPPRHLKSIMGSVALPAWVLGHTPSSRIICVSYSSDLAAKFTRDFRRILESSWYQQAFPATRISRTKNTETEIETTAGGGRLATSTGGTLTGRGGDWLIIDDPLKQDEAASEARREAVNDWFFNTAINRLDNRNTGRIVVAMQRLHPRDLSGVLLETGSFEHLCIPAIADVAEDIALGSHHIKSRKPGEVLHPALESAEQLEVIKLGMGSALFEAQYQQRPAPAEGQMLRVAWLHPYTMPPEANYHTLPIISVDTASKATELADYSVCMVFLHDKKAKLSYLVDVVRRRLEYPELKRKILELYRKHSPHYLLIEDKGAGTSLIQEFRREGIWPIAINPRDEKIIRVQAVTAALERGELMIPTAASWLGDFITEFAGYPSVLHDDQVDCLAQYLNWLPDGTRPKAGIYPGALRFY